MWPADVGRSAKHYSRDELIRRSHGRLDQEIIKSTDISSWSSSKKLSI